MAVSAGISNALERNWGMVDRAIDGLSDETLARQISDSDNSIGWLLFHMSRVVDVFMNARFQGKPQIWIEDGWCEKFGLGDDPETTGQGWDTVRLAAWPLPSKDVLVGYYEAMKACCRDYMSFRDRRGVERHHEPESRFGSRAERDHHGCPGL